MASRKKPSRTKRAGKRRRSRRIAYTTPGALPGTLKIDPSESKPLLGVVAYGPEGFEELEDVAVADLKPLLAKWPVVWVNVEGLGEAEPLLRLAELFRLHPLALEDVVNRGRRPKAEPFEEDLLVLLRMPGAGEELESEQLSLFLGRDFVLTFHPRTGDCFEGVRERIRRGSGRIRHSGADFLLYALVDAVMDSFLPLLERIGTRLELLEDEVLAGADHDFLGRVYDVRRDLLELRSDLWPQRDVLHSLARDDSPFVKRETNVFFRDCYSQAVHMVDLLEAYREIVAGLMSTYLSVVSNRMNEVMKVLTIIATIFIPLSFVAGVYGMNFDPEVSPWNMPELEWMMGYPFALFVMAMVAGGMLLFFKRKGWL